jgi:ATP-dependent helicase/DNAse subunit B
VAVPKFEGLYISISQVKSYLRCPRQYRLRYIMGLRPAFVPLALAFGSAIHSALAEYYEVVKRSGTRPPLEDILSVFISSAILREG